MPNVNIVRLSDRDIDRLAAAMAERTGAQLTEIAARLTAIEARLSEKKAGKKKNEATISELHRGPDVPV